MRLIYLGALLLTLGCLGCNQAGLIRHSDISFFSTDTALEQAGIYLYLNGAERQIAPLAAAIRTLEVYDATAEVWLPLERSPAGENHPDGQRYLAGSLLAPGLYPHLRITMAEGDTTTPQNVPTGLARLEAGERVCLQLWLNASSAGARTQEGTPTSNLNGSWHVNVAQPPYTGDLLAVLGGGGTEVLLLRSDNLHTRAAIGLQEQWNDWHLLEGEGIWGLAPTSMTLRERGSWRVLDRLGLPLVEHATEFAPAMAATAASGADPTFFITDSGGNRLVSIGRRNGAQNIYAAGFSPTQILLQRYASGSGTFSNGGDGELIVVSAADGVYLFDPQSGANRRHSSAYRVADMAGSFEYDIDSASNRVILALERINEVHSYALPEFSLQAQYLCAAPPQQVLVVRNQVLVATGSGTRNTLIWLNLRDMTRMGQLPLPFPVADMLYSPVTSSVYALSRDGVHLLQIDSISRRIDRHITLPTPGRRLLLLEQRRAESGVFHP
ncbi:MAG: hypothetical protein RBR43_00975 [Desulfuromonadaceae bacterium]|nr:hypothetical protein [Desulfuromonas sp.]MDY0184435.1 hypothetical protein [Desulfuromonadaceae bacterium]